MPVSSEHHRGRAKATRILPALAGWRAFRTFCTPSQSRHRSSDHERLVERARFHLRLTVRHDVATRAGPVAVHVMEPSGEPRANVLVVHGWTSEASFMVAIGDFLRRRGYRAILPDMPAHGLTGGKRASLIDCAHALQGVLTAFAPVEFVVGHSMGGLAALLAGEGGPPMPEPTRARAYALLAVPDRFGSVTQSFGRELGLDARAQRNFERRLERIAQRRVHDFNASALLGAIARPALLIHARDDDAVPFADAERIASLCPAARLAAFDGLGHRTILYASPVVREIARFIETE